jgi:hypothetical protein
MKKLKIMLFISMFTCVTLLSSCMFPGPRQMNRGGKQERHGIQNNGNNKGHGNDKSHGREKGRDNGNRHDN